MRNLDEDEEEDEAKLIFPYEAEGSPYPPPLASPNVEPEMNIADHVLWAIRERAERDLYEMMDWAHGFYEGMLMIKAVRDRPCEAIDVLAVFGES
ncbi:hypothetical protein Tco_0546149 [Tanacetum coccineum]